MGLFGFGNKDEINIKAQRGRVKAIVSRSFMGGSELLEHLEGDTLSLSAFRGLSSSLNNRLAVALGEFDGGGCRVDVTRYGSIEVCVTLGEEKTSLAGNMLDSFCEALTSKGYDAFCSTGRKNASICVSKSGLTSANYETVLGNLLNDVAMVVINRLQRV